MDLTVVWIVAYRPITVRPLIEPGASGMASTSAIRMLPSRRDGRRTEEQQQKKLCAEARASSERLGEDKHRNLFQTKNKRVCDIERTVLTKQATVVVE